MLAGALMPDFDKVKSPRKAQSSIYFATHCFERTDIPCEGRSNVPKGILAEWQADRNMLVKAHYLSNKPRVCASLEDEFCEQTER